MTNFCADCFRAQLLLLLCQRCCPSLHPAEHFHYLPLTALRHTFIMSITEHHVILITITRRLWVIHISKMWYICYSSAGYGFLLTLHWDWCNEWCMWYMWHSNQWESDTKGPEMLWIRTVFILEWQSNFVTPVKNKEREIWWNWCREWFGPPVHIWSDVLKQR